MIPERKVCAVVLGREISVEYYAFEVSAKHLLTLPFLSLSTPLF